MTKILLVEDDKSLREIYGVRLLAEGYDIVSAGDGEEALAMAIKDRPDLILSDVMMPKISGFDMLDILRSTTETKAIKVIMMTALSSEEQRQRGVNLGADRYLVKSQVGIEDVVRTVHEVLADAPVSGQPSLVSPPPAPTPESASSTAPQPLTNPQPPAPTEPTLVAMPTPPVSVPVASTTPSTPASTPQPTTPTPALHGPVSLPQPPVAATTPAPVSTPAPAANAAQPPVPSPAAEPSAAPSTVSAPGTLPESVLPQPTSPLATPKPPSLANRVIEPLPSSQTQGPDIGNLMNKELEARATNPDSGGGLEFEETPRPAGQQTATGGTPLPPAPPAPSTGV